MGKKRKNRKKFKKLLQRLRMKFMSVRPEIERSPDKLRMFE